MFNFSKKLQISICLLVLNVTSNFSMTPGELETTNAIAQFPQFMDGKDTNHSAKSKDHKDKNDKKDHKDKKDKNDKKDKEDKSKVNGYDVFQRILNMIFGYAIPE